MRALQVGRAMLFVIAALGSCQAFAAGQCQPEETPAFAFVCDRAVMDAGTPFERMLGRSAEDLGQEPLPGRGELTLDGLVGESGHVCAMPVGEPTLTGALTGGIMSLGEAEARAQAMREAFADLEQDSGGAAAIRRLAEITREISQATRSDASGAVLQVFSPNTLTWVGQVGSGPAEHGGVAGWSPNSVTNLVVHLPDVASEALREGEMYRAEAVAGEAAASLNTFFFADWKGTVQPYSRRGEGEAMRWKKLRDMQVAMGADPEWIDQYLPSPGQNVAFEGVKRVLTGRIEGTVTIERVSAGSVAGKLELAGTGTLSRTQSEFIRSSGAVTGDRVVEDEEVSGPIRFEGSFEAPNVGTGHVQRASYASVHVTPQSPEEEKEAEFEIARHWPAVNERNLPTTFPPGQEGWVEFTRALDPGQDLSSRVGLIWRDASGTRQQHPLDVAIEGAQLRYAPRTPLKAGTWYEIELRNLRAADGDLLAPEEHWRFATLPEPSRDRNGISLYQTSANADLVVGKPTLARIDFTWERPENVHPDWQVQQLSYTAWSEGDSGARLHDSVEGLVWRDDLQNADDRLHARDTINLFDWRPKAGEATTITGVIEPEQCLEPADRFRVEDPRLIRYMPEAIDLRIAAYFVRVGEWRDSVPKDDRVIAERIMREAADFATQVLPIRSANAILVGEVSLPADARQLEIEAEVAQDEAREAVPFETYRGVMQQFHDRIATNTPAHISVALLPSGYLDAGGEGVGPMSSRENKINRRIFENGVVVGYDAIDYSVVVPTVSVTTTVRSLSSNAVSHEIGHVFGLDHVPYGESRTLNRSSCTDDRRRYPGIDGFRIALDGQSGLNKSSVDGNEEHPPILLPLMFPCIRPAADVWTTDSSYAAAQRRIGEQARMGMWQNFAALNLPATRLLAGPADGAEVWRDLLVGGTVGPDGSAIDLALPLDRRLPAHLRPGEYVLEGLDGAGEVLAEAAVAPGPDGRFRAVLRQAENAATLRLREGGTVLAEVGLGRDLPTVGTFEVQDGPDGPFATWRASTGSGRAVHTTVLWRAAVGPWQPVGLGGASGSVALPEEAAFARIVVDDGLAVADRTVARVTGEDGGSGIAHRADRMSVGGLTVLLVDMTRPLDPSSAKEDVQVIDAEGRALPLEVNYTPPMQRLMVMAPEIPEGAAFALSPDLRFHDGASLGRPVVIRPEARE